MTSFRPWRLTILALACGAVVAATPHDGSAASVVRFDSVLGSFDVQLFDASMPRTVTNFLGYVNSDRYDGTTVHRNSDTSDPILRDFVIQGGGFTLLDPTPPNTVISFRSVETDPPISDEPGNLATGPSNQRGTIAMAKSGPNTVTSQWFINQGDNSFLDSPLRSDGGFSAFGMVLGDGMDVVDAIGDLPLPSNFGFGISSPFNDLPLRNFTGTSITDIRVANTVTINSISQLSLGLGDLDRDGDTDNADFAILNVHLGLASGAYLDDGDADMDGDVDGTDLLLWQRGLALAASTFAAASVPEPNTCILLFFSTLLSGRGLTARRRRIPRLSDLAALCMHQ